MSRGQDNDPRARPSTPRSSTVGKAYASRGESRRQYLTRLPESTYEALMNASDATGVSANALVTEAIDSYLAGPAFSERLHRSLNSTSDKAGKTIEAERRREEAIRKLSGG